METLKRHIPYLKTLPLILVSILIFKAVDRLDMVHTYLVSFVKLLVPFIWAGVIAYLLNPLLRICQKRLGLGRKRSLTVIYLLVIAVLYGVVTIMGPILISSSTQLIRELPGYIVRAQEWTLLKSRALQLDQLALTYGIDLETLPLLQPGAQVGMIFTKIQSSLMGVLGAIVDITTSIVSFIIGLIISAYILKDKETFSINLLKYGKAWIGEPKALKIAEVIRESDRIFSGFIIGKLIDSLIIGVLCFAGLYLMHMPYALLLTVMIAVFNMIPYFGIYIGTVPATLLVLFYNPVQALWLAGFLLILQKFDAYVLGPKILGDSVGLPPFWIIVSLLLGGEMFGIIGMIVAVPTFAVIMHFLEQVTEKRIHQKQRDIAQ